jgi:HSP20 family protein
MSTSRWDPLSDLVSLREAMNNLLEESFVRPRSGAPATAPAGLALDVQETPDAFKLVASVPGVGADDVEITVLGDTVRIRGERREQHEEGGQDGRWLIRERRFGAFERSVTLPATVRSDAASADFQDGVLTVTLPKAEEAKPRSIPVRGGAAAGSSQPREIEVESGKADAGAGQ